MKMRSRSRIKEVVVSWSQVPCELEVFTIENEGQEQDQQGRVVQEPLLSGASERLPDRRPDPLGVQVSRLGQSSSHMGIGGICKLACTLHDQRLTAYIFIHYLFIF